MCWTRLVSLTCGSGWVTQQPVWRALLSSESIHCNNPPAPPRYHQHTLDWGQGIAQDVLQVNSTRIPMHRGLIGAMHAFASGLLDPQWCINLQRKPLQKRQCTAVL